MIFYLVTYGIDTLACPRMLGGYQNGGVAFFNPHQNISPAGGTFTAQSNVESWLFLELKDANEKAKALCTLHNRPYAVCEVELMGHFKPAVATWERDWISE